jgi:hypothetical protein
MDLKGRLILAPSIFGFPLGWWVTAATRETKVWIKPGQLPRGEL